MTILLIDDDDVLRAMLRQAFELEAMPVEAFADPAEVLARVTPAFAGAVVTDVRMAGIDGMELFRRLRAIDPEVPVIVMTGHADVPMVIDALKRGVFDFIPKPFSSDHLVASARRALDHRALVLENRALRAAAEGVDDGELLVGETPVMVRLRQTVRQVALADIDVLVEGETGTGKELVALLLHRWSGRRAGPFIAVNCAAMPTGIAEAELFGYAPGVHAHYRGGHAGRIEQASGGTLFLDEIGNMPLPLQGALLRVIEEREVTPIGGERPRPVNLRIVASANTDLAAAVEEGRVRKDLFYRLNAVQIRVPPLRDRLDDVPILFARFLHEAAERSGTVPPLLDAQAHAHLRSHDWPGNVRELRSYAQRLALRLDATEPNSPASGDLAQQVADFEATAIRHALAKAGGDVNATLALLNVARNTLYDKLKRYGIRPADYR